MMHLFLLALAITIAWYWRQYWKPSTSAWNQRWSSTLSAFLLPPLLLLSTAIALVLMGPKGQMVCWWEGWSSYGIGIGWLAFAAALAGKLAGAGRRSLRQIRQYPAIPLQGREVGRLLPTPLPFVAQVGFWQPELVISQGLLDTLDAEHLTAVLLHEQAHAKNHDTFWFFWLGWLRELTAWLPHTDYLWQELLMLREIRADLQAAQVVDGLVLAEALLTVVSVPAMQPDGCFAALSEVALRDRLNERIDALLTKSTTATNDVRGNWWHLTLIFLPLLLIPFHS